MMLTIEMRWYRGVDDDTFKLQYRNVMNNGAEATYGPWETVPRILEGVGEV